MQREIYQVNAFIVDSNGTFNTLSGYPKAFDSRVYDNNVEKAMNRAYGDWHECLGAMCKRDDRELQVAMIVRVSDGVQIASSSIGTLAPLPDPESEITEE